VSTKPMKIMSSLAERGEMQMMKVREDNCR
jgi:hypothetical protein